MRELAAVAPAFVHMAHTIVWCTTATVDPKGRPRSRILHPLWEWDGTQLVGWIAITNTRLKREHIDANPYVSCSYWDDTHDTCTAECEAELLHDDETRIAVWNKFLELTPPLGYDPAKIPVFSGPTDDSLAVLRLTPWHLRVFPGGVLFNRGEVLTWSR
jgi:hypothetical protein